MGEAYQCKRAPGCSSGQSHEDHTLQSMGGTTGQRRKPHQIPTIILNTRARAQEYNSKLKRIAYICFGGQGSEGISECEHTKSSSESEHKYLHKSHFPMTRVRRKTAAPLHTDAESLSLSSSSSNKRFPDKARSASTCASQVFDTITLPHCEARSSLSNPTMSVP